MFYLGYYDLPKNTRMVSLAGVTMMDYVSRAIQQAGCECVILSPAQSIEKKPIEKAKLNDGRKVLFLSSYGTASKANLFKRAYLRVRREMALYKMLDKQVKDGDVLLVYHSLAYINVLRRLRKKKKFILLLQVCEIYADVSQDEKKKRKELKWIAEADAYIFSTNNLEQSLNTSHKPSQVCLGTYTVEENSVSKSNERECIHVVYAGTFDPRKGGGQAAVAAAAFLPSRYHVHIIGFGSDGEVALLKRQIEDVSTKSSCTVTYDGCFSGHDYIEFIQHCDIGLCTQDPNAAFNATSFPSKILSYMSNGLSVVSARIPAIVNSSVGDLITYYDTQTPEEIANAILKVNLENKGSKEQARIKELDKRFQEGVKSILNSLSSNTDAK